MRMRFRKRNALKMVGGEHGETRRRFRKRNELNTAWWEENMEK